MEWISVKDRLPGFMNEGSTISLPVLVFIPDDIKPDIVVVSHWSKKLNGWTYYGDVNSTWEYRGCTVTHWMPLPEPPTFED